MASGALVIAIQFEFDTAKTQSALAYLAGKRLPDFDPDKAMVLLFLADREHLLRFGRTITGDRYEARGAGPVAVETEKSHLANKPTFDYDEEALSESDHVVLDHVAQEYGAKTCAEIGGFTRNLTAYRNARIQGGEREDWRMRFEDFFAEAPDRAPILQEIKEEQQLRRMFSDASA